MNHFRLKSVPGSVWQHMDGQRRHERGPRRLVGTCALRVCDDPTSATGTRGYEGEGRGEEGLTSHMWLMTTRHWMGDRREQVQWSPQTR